MADDFIIQARIVVNESGAITGVTGVDQAMGRLDTRTATVNGGVRRLMGAFAALGGVFALGRAAAGAVGLHSEIQNAEGALATLFSSLGGMEIAGALSLARSEIVGLRADAAAGVGELNDYTTAYSRLAAPLLKAGLGTEDIRAFTRQSLTAGFAARGQEGLRLAPMDIVQALQGGVNDKITPIASQALAAVNITQAKFNKLDTSKKIEALQKAFKTFEAGAELMGRSWEAQMATARDGAREVARTVTKPLFDRWSEQLMASNKWLESNKETLGGIAEQVGGALLRAYDQLISKATTYAAIVAGIALSQQLPGQGKGGAGGFRIPDFSGGAAQGFFGKAKGRDVKGKFTAATSGIFGTGGLKTMAANFTRVAGPMALMSALALSLAGAMGEWPELWGLLVGLGGSLTISFGMLGASFGSLTEDGSALNIVGGALVLMFAGMGAVLNIAVRGLALVIEGIGFFVIALGTLAKTAFATVGMITGALFGDPAMVRQARGDFAKWRAEGQAGLGESQERMRKILGLSGDLATELKTDEAGGALEPDKLITGKNVTNIGKVEMRIQTEVNNDPARVMVALNEGLGQLRRFSRQAQRAPLPTV